MNATGRNGPWRSQSHSRKHLSHEACGGYRMRSGFDPRQGGIVRLSELSQPGWFDWLGVGATALMLATAVLLVRWAAKAEPLSRTSEVREADAAPAL